MAEDGDEELGGSAPDTAMAATAMALDAAERDPSLKRKTEVFLDAQVSLIDLHKHHLHEQFKHLRLRILEQRLGVLLRAMTAIVGLAIAIGLGAAIWSAAHDDSLVIEAFSVPPDMAERGLTGQAVAAQLQDKLAAMQNATKSARPAESYSNNWGNDIKVQIPETGVSIGQFYGLLVTWLGRETHITGEVFHAATGIAITARGGSEGGGMVTGAEADFDKLLQQAAEKIYLRTQPYRYAVYLESSGPAQYDRVREILQHLAAQNSQRERAWAYIGLAVLDYQVGDLRQGIMDAHRALALAPDFAMAYENLDSDEAVLGHDEASLAAAQSAVEVLQRGRNVDMSDLARSVSLPLEQSDVDFALNDFAAALRDGEEITQLPDFNGSVEYARQANAVVQALLHSGAASRGAWRDLPPSRDPLTLSTRDGTKILVDYWLGDWSAFLAEAPALERDWAKQSLAAGASARLNDVMSRRLIWPYIAGAMAMVGDFKGAHALIDKTPLDCYTCVRNRADIDAAERNWGGAEYWFEHAVRQAPSIPLGYLHWGRMLLAKGDFDGAIAKFKTANDKGPHFADPLELWGEALIAKNRSDLALAKFAEADKYAPNWGRLHLKWGEALLWSGDKNGAAKQFATASRLDLSAADKSTLARMGAKHG